MPKVTRVYVGPRFGITIYLNDGTVIPILWDELPESIQNAVEGANNVEVTNDGATMVWPDLGFAWELADILKECE